MITVNHISYSYKTGEGRQLSDVSMEIRKGDFILLCGKSGSGKTTLIKLINGLIPHFVEGELSGAVTIGGKDTAQMKIYEISEQVGSVFQNPKTQFFNPDSDSELLFALENMGADPERIVMRVNQTVSDLGIGHLKNRDVYKMSGGEKQLLAIASVYAAEPEIYVFDEPSSNLDEAGMETLREVFRKLKAQGKTIVISEHRLYYFIDFVDRAYYLEDGRITGMFGQGDINRLSDDERKRLGLRALRKPGLKPDIKPAVFDAGDELLLENISFRRDGKSVLQGIDLSAKRGDVMAITGANGAGKSTLMRLLCGLLKETGGRIRYMGKEYKYKKRHHLCYMVMQDVIHQLFAESVKEEFLMTSPGLEEAEIDGFLDRMGLMKYRETYPLSLSGGQMQRLAVAVAMLMNKEIMILDEPTAGLDYSNMLRISAVIRELSRDKIVFIITHDRELIDACCTKIVRLENGRIQEGGGIHVCPETS